ncbi:MAG: hypothetical protein AMXMBFR82_09670 [Candidatus Hydrogenedentota bacterium]
MAAFEDRNGSLQTAEPPPLPAGTPWGFWATTGFLLVAAGVIIAVFLGFLYGAEFILEELLDVADARSVLDNPFVEDVTTVPLAFLMVAMLVFFASRKKGITLRQYFSLSPLRLRTIVSWSGMVIVISLTYITCCVAWELPVRLSYTSYANAHPLVVRLVLLSAAAETALASAMILGFQFAGFRASRLGDWGTVVVITAMWSPLSLQDGYFEFAFDVAETGLIAIARLRTRSLYPPIAMGVVATFTEMLAVIGFGLPFE